MREVLRDGVQWLVIWVVSFGMVAFVIYDLKFFIYERRNNALNKDLIRYVGNRCRAYRQSIGVKQEVVAKETGYSIETVSGFENGRNNNASILLWYIAKGMKFDKGDHDGN